MNPTVLQINALLPQTQCRECGFSGCLPYAQALVQDKAPANLCAPGGKAVAADLARLLGQPEVPPAKTQPRALAQIDEAGCIGCTACIRACPVDAIMGASKHMHTVLAEECTGCGLCVAPCPTDCITMQPTAAEFLPQARTLSNDARSKPRFQAASHAQARYENRNLRKQQAGAARKQQHAARQRPPEKTAAATSAPNPAALIAQAMQRAQEQQNRAAVPANRQSFRDSQIRTAQERAAYRRYRHEAEHGSGERQAAAIEWLRQHKAAQEAAETSR